MQVKNASGGEGTATSGVQSVSKKFVMVTSLRRCQVVRNKNSENKLEKLKIYLSKQKRNLSRNI